MTDADARCPHCDAPLPPYAGRGQRRVWCSARCRRAGWAARRRDDGAFDLMSADLAWGERDDG